MDLGQRLATVLHTDTYSQRQNISNGAALGRALNACRCLLSLRLGQGTAANDFQKMMAEGATMQILSGHEIWLRLA